MFMTSPVRNAPERHQEHARVDLMQKKRTPTLSAHAKVRCQQRGIPESAVALIGQYGERRHDSRGGVRMLMTGRAMHRLVRERGRDQMIDRLRGCYLVQSLANGEVIVTVGHRHR